MSAAEWLGRLAPAEEHLVPADLRRAASFLRGHRNPDEGWGDHPRLPTDIQVTAQVITALQALRDPKAGELVAGVAAWARDRYADRPPTTAQDAIGLLTLATADQDLDGHYPQRLRTVLGAAMARLDSDRVSTPTLAQAVLAAEPWTEEHRQRARPWARELARRGQGADAWHRSGLPEESLAVTSLAVRALAPWRDGDQKAAKAVRHGLEHLRSHLLAQGWESSTLSGTYALTLVLRALATDPEGAPELLEEGVDLLRSRQGSDGGWTGGTPGSGPSSIEHTAVAVTALVESGACRYVPMPAAGSVIRELRTELEEVARRRAALEQDIEEQIDERLGKAAAERRQLRRRLQETEAELERVREREKLRDSVPEPRAVPVWPTWRQRRTWVLAGGALFSFAAVLIADKAGAPGWAPAAGILITSVLLSVMLVPRARTKPEPQPPESPSARRAARLAEEFMDATASLPSSVREEFVYRLARESNDLPAELYLRFLIELTSQLKIDRDSERQLHRWTEQYALIEPHNRHTLISRLRRMVL